MLFFAMILLIFSFCDFCSIVLYTKLFWLAWIVVLFVSVPSLFFLLLDTCGLAMPVVIV